MLFVLNEDNSVNCFMNEPHEAENIIFDESKMKIVESEPPQNEDSENYYDYFLIEGKWKHYRERFL